MRIGDDRTAVTRGGSTYRPVVDGLRCRLRDCARGQRCERMHFGDRDDGRADRRNNEDRERRLRADVLHRHPESGCDGNDVQEDQHNETHPGPPIPHAAHAHCRESERILGSN